MKHSPSHGHDKTTMSVHAGDSCHKWLPDHFLNVMRVWCFFRCLGLFSGSHNRNVYKRRKTTLGVESVLFWHLVGWVSSLYKFCELTGKTICSHSPCFPQCWHVRCSVNTCEHKLSERHFHK